MMFTWIKRLLISIGLSLLLLNSACGQTIVIDETAQGGPTPEAVVESFLEDLNDALNDPALDQADVRRAWAARMAGYFAPSERIDQQTVLGEMLAGFVFNARQPVVGERMVMEVAYEAVEILSRTEDTAQVQVIDGIFVLRWLNADGDPIRERRGNLMDVIGQTSGALPVLRVGAQWFLTEG